MREELAILLDDFLAQNWTEWESFCDANNLDAEEVYIEVQDQTGQY